MTSQILIEELSPAQAGIITESSPDGKNMWLNGIFMQADIKNRNGRVYPIMEIQAAVNSGQRIISESNGIMGELDHPQSLSINLDRVSHIITEIGMVGSNAIGKAKLLSTPMGNIAKELSNSQVALGVSSRGAGNVNESSGQVSSFMFVTVDIVAQPSAPGAIPTSVLESLELATNGKEIIHLAEQVKHDPVAQAYFKKEIMKFLETGLFAKR
jgi:translation initiation factor RLI1